MDSKDYRYPALVNFENNQFTLNIPDIPSIQASHVDKKELYLLANDLLKEYILSLEHQNKIIPKPTQSEYIKVGNNQELVKIGYIQTKRGKITLIPPARKSTQEEKEDFYRFIAELAFKYCKNSK